jgi:hypothetical protein
MEWKRHNQHLGHPAYTPPAEETGQFLRNCQVFDVLEIAKVDYIISRPLSEETFTSCSNLYPQCCGIEGVRVSKMSRSSSGLTSGGREDALKVRKKEAPNALANEFAYERYGSADRVYGLWFMVCGLGFRVKGLGLRI